MTHKSNFLFSIIWTTIFLFSILGVYASYTAGVQKGSLDQRSYYTLLGHNLAMREIHKAIKYEIRLYDKGKTLFDPILIEQRCRFQNLKKIGYCVHELDGIKSIAITCFDNYCAEEYLINNL